MNKRVKWTIECGTCGKVIVKGDPNTYRLGLCPKCYTETDDLRLIDEGEGKILDVVIDRLERCKKCHARKPCESGRDGDKTQISIMNGCAVVMLDEIQKVRRTK